MTQQSFEHGSSLHHSRYIKKFNSQSTLRAQVFKGLRAISHKLRSIARTTSLAALMSAAGCASPITEPPGVSRGCALELNRADMGRVENNPLTRAIQQKNIDPNSTDPTVVNMLILSGGGKYGAYGAGFLNGWSRAEAENSAPLPRTRIDVVTGVSTGALLATHATIGNAWPANSTERLQYDREIQNYYDTSDDELFKSIGLIEAVLGSNGLADVSDGLAKSVDTIFDQHGPQMASLASSKQTLVGLANLTNGAFYFADLNKVAGTNQEWTKDCYRELILGSAAVPAQFAPRFIDGHPYVDGGVRFGAFLGRMTFDEQRRLAGFGNRDAPNIKINLRVIINGTLSANGPAKDPQRALECQNATLQQLDEACPAIKNRLLPVVKRSAADILVDQLYRDSVFRLERDLQAAGLLETSKYTYVSLAEIAREDRRRNGKCRAATKQAFDNQFMKCLFDIGFEKGKEQRWNEFEEMPRLITNQR